MKIVVIGATGTIGRAVADAFSKREHEVIRTSRGSDPHVDIDDPATLQMLFERVKDIDAVVSCAGHGKWNLRVNVVSPHWVTETLRSLKMDESRGLAATDVAKAYVAAVEGTMNGEVLEPATFV